MARNRAGRRVFGVSSAAKQTTFLMMLLEISGFVFSRNRISL